MFAGRLAYKSSSKFSSTSAKHQLEIFNVLREAKDFEKVYCSSQAKFRGCNMTPFTTTGSPVIACVNSMDKIDKIGSIGARLRPVYKEIGLPLC